jgi:hypothetical protein
MLPGRHLERWAGGVLGEVLGLHSSVLIGLGLMSFCHLQLACALPSVAAPGTDFEVIYCRIQ